MAKGKDGFGRHLSGTTPQHSAASVKTQGDTIGGNKGTLKGMSEGKKTFAGKKKG